MTTAVGVEDAAGLVPGVVWLPAGGVEPLLVPAAPAGCEPPLDVPPPGSVVIAVVGAVTCAPVWFFPPAKRSASPTTSPMISTAPTSDITSTFQSVPLESSIFLTSRVSRLCASSRIRTMTGPAGSTGLTFNMVKSRGEWKIIQFVQ